MYKNKNYNKNRYKSRNEQRKNKTNQTKSRKYITKEPENFKFSPDVVKRGQIYYIKSHPQHRSVGCEMWSDRPAIIVSNNTMNAAAKIVEVIYLTTSTRKKLSPTHVNVKVEGKEAIAICEQIHTVSVDRMGRFMGEANEDEMHEIDEAIAYSVGLKNKCITNALFKKWENYIKDIDLSKEVQTSHYDSQRVHQLEASLEMMRSERDAYKKLYEIHVNKDKGVF